MTTLKPNSNPYEKLKISEKNIKILKKNEEKFKYIELKNSRFEELNEFYKTASLIILAFFDDSIPELKAFSLNYFIEKILPVDQRAYHLKCLLKILKYLLI